MIKVNDIRIDTNISSVNNYLVVDIAIPDLDVKEFPWITSATIDTVGIVEAGDYKEGIDKYNFPGVKFVVKDKEFRKLVSDSDLPSNVDITKGLLLVYIFIDDGTGGMMPCNASKFIIPVYNKCNIAKLLASTLEQAKGEERCVSNVDYSKYLLYKHMSLAFCLGRYSEGIDDYNKLMKNNGNTTVVNKCGCGR